MPFMRMQTIKKTWSSVVLGMMWYSIADFVVVSYALNIRMYALCKEFILSYPETAKCMLNFYMLLYFLSPHRCR